MAIQGDLAQILSGMPIKVAGCNIAISQPSIQDICAFGEDTFFMGIQIFLHIENFVKPVKEGNSRLQMLSDFQVLIVILNEDNTTKQAIDDLFTIIFPNYIWRYDAGSINFHNEENGPIVGQLNPMNFETFQGCLKTLFLPQGADGQEDYNPANARAAEIAAKLRRGNEIRAQMKQEKNNKNMSLFANYTSALAIGLSMDIHILFSYTPFQLYDAFTRYTKKMAFDLYQKVSTTPMMDTSKMDEPDNWIDSLYN